MTIGKRIRKLREIKGYTREQLAEMADISVNFLYEIERDKKGFSALILFSISEALGVSMDYIMTGDGEVDYGNKIVEILAEYQKDELDCIYLFLEKICEIVQMADINKDWTTEKSGSKVAERIKRNDI